MESVNQTGVATHALARRVGLAEDALGLALGLAPADFTLAGRALDFGLAIGLADAFAGLAGALALAPAGFADLLPDLDLAGA